MEEFGKGGGGLAERDGRRTATGLGVVAGGQGQAQVSFLFLLSFSISASSPLVDETPRGSGKPVNFLEKKKETPKRHFRSDSSSRGHTLLLDPAEYGDLDKNNSNLK
jgi:hypothetical protein